MTDQLIKYVDVGVWNGDKFELLARCLWSGQAVAVTGPDQSTVDLLTMGVPGAAGELIRPEDGLKFLAAVAGEFRTPYLLATEIQEGEPPPLA